MNTYWCVECSASSWRYVAILMVQLLAFYTEYTFGSKVAVGGQIIIIQQGFGKGPWTVKALAVDGTVSIQDANGKNYNLHKSEYIPMVESLGETNLKSEFIGHKTSGRGIWPVKGIAANGVLLSVSAEKKWVEFWPHEYTVLVAKKGNVKKGGYVFPLIDGRPGAWPVLELGADGTVVTQDAKGGWLRMSESEYVPEASSYKGFAAGQNVIVLRDGILNLWNINHIGTDGRIEVKSKEGNHYTVYPNEYIKTVAANEKIRSTDKIFVKRQGFNGEWPIKAIGIDGRLLIEDANGKQYLLGRSEYMPTVASVDLSSNQQELSKISTRAPVEIPKKKERWIEVRDQDIENGTPTFLKAKIKTSLFSSQALEMWVYPISLHGKEVEVALVKDVMAATKLKNSIRSFLVPREWLFASTEEVNAAELSVAPIGQLADSHTFNLHLVPPSAKDQGNILAQLKGKSMVEEAGKTGCQELLSGVATSNSLVAKGSITSD